MDKAANDPITTYFRHSVSTMERAAGDETLHRAIRTMADLIETIFRSGNKLMLAGNGGSAGDAQHIAGEFLSRLEFRSRSASGHCLEYGYFGAYCGRQ